MKRFYISLILLVRGDALIFTGSATSTYLRPRISTDRLRTACLTAKHRLGDTQVDIHPLRNSSVAEENWSEACWQLPYCIIQPTNPTGVAESIKIIASLRVPFAVRAGGHSPNPRWSSVGSHGILLDLQRLNTVTLSNGGSVVGVGAGARWGPVYDVLGTQGRAAIGARSRSVGVGGSILGGGYHHLSNQFGLAVDNVQNFQVVLANGSIVDANARQNQELFWALKGGGSNFGIVTRFDLYTLPVPTVWAKIDVYSPDQVPALIAAFDEWQRSGPPSDVRGNADLIISIDFAVLILVYSEPATKSPDVFAPFRALEPVQTVLPPTNLTIGQLSQILESTGSAAPARHDYQGFSSLVDTNLTQDMYGFWLERATAVRDATGISQTFVLQHVSQNLIDVGKKNGGNALNISPPQSQQWWTTIIDWKSAEDDDVARSVAIATTSLWRTLSEERGSSSLFLFMNDASRDQNPLASYGQQSLKQLRVVSKRYDRTRVFQDLQSGGFLLSRA